MERKTHPHLKVMNGFYAPFINEELFNDTYINTATELDKLGFEKRAIDLVTYVLGNI